MAKKSYPAPIPPVWNRLSITPERWREYQTFNPSNLGNISYENMSNYLVYDLNKDLINNTKDFKPFLEKDAIGDYSNPIMVQGLKNKMMKQGWALDTKTGSQVALPKDLISFMIGTPETTPTISQQAITPAATQPVIPATTGKIIRQPGDPKYVAPTNTPPAYTSPMGYPKTPMPYNNALHTNGGVLNYNQQFLDGGPLVDETNHGKLLNSVYASALGNYYANGGMLKRADGSYSQRGLWDNIRANKGSGKKPTKEMLAQEKKINKEYAEGGYLGDKGNTQVHTDKAGNTTTKFTKPDGTTYIKVKNANGKVYNKTISSKDALQNKFNILQKQLKTYDSQNGGQGPTNMSDMFKRADVFKQLVELEANNQDRIKSTPRIDQMEAVGNTMLTAGKYFMPAPVKTGINYLLNASDAVDYIQDPNNESNKVSIVSDVLSPLKSAKTKMAPFSVISDVVNLKQQYDKFNNANNEVYNVQHANGGQFTKPYSLPEDSFKQGGNNLHNSVYASSMEQYPAPYEYGGPMSRFYASNVEEPATIGKDLAYNKGGNMNYRYNSQFAEGGNLDPLTTFDEGGKHSENPLGGIPQGQNAQGGMNLVEEGETKLNSKDYIFSDTLKVDKDTVAEFNLPKTMIGKTFADASKKMNRPDSRRINDSIEEKAKERDLNALMEAQEVFKEREVAKKMEEIQSLNPGLFEQMQQAQMQPQGQPSPEEMMMQQGQAPMDPNAQPQMDPAMMEQMAMQQGIPQQYGGQMYYQYGGQMYDFGGKLGEGIKNYGLGMADTTMSYLGMDNVIKDDQYEGFGADVAKGYAKVVGGLGKKVLPMAANMVVPGSGMAISGAQQLGSMVNPQQQPPQQFKYGGTFDMPRQQMYMPLDHVTEMGGELSIEDQGLQNLENDYRNSIFEEGGKFIDKEEPVYNAQTNQYCYPDGTCIGIKNPDQTLYNKLPKILGDVGIANNKDWFTDGQLDMRKISNKDILSALNNTKESTKFFTGTNEWGAELNETPTNLENWVNTWKNYQTKNQEVYGLKDIWNVGKNEGYNNWLNATGTNNSDPNVTNPSQTNPFLQTKKIEYSKDELARQQASVAKQKEKDIRETRNQNDPRLADLYTNLSPEGYPSDAVPIRGAVKLNSLPINFINQSYNSQLANPYIKSQGFTAEQLAAQEAEPITYPNTKPTISTSPVSSKNVTSYNPDTAFSFTPTPMSMQENEPQMYPTMTNVANTENTIVPTVANNIVDDYSNRQMIASQEAESIMYPPDATQYPQGLNYTQLNSAIDPRLQNSEMEVAQKMLRDASTEEEHALALEAYQSAVARHDESLKNRNVDLTMNQTPMQAIGSALPIGYNIGMGLFGKPQQLKESDYMQKADIKAPEMNINPQLRATDQSFAQASNAGRNAGAGSEYLAYMSNLNNIRNKGYADLYGQKFNVDSQNAMNAQLQNKAIEGQNLQTKMGIVDYNAKAKAAKTAMLQEGFKQAATLADNSKSMDAQLALMKAIAPDFAGDFKYNTIFDQYKNRTKKV